MTVQDALSRFSDACPAEWAKNGYARCGNWQPIARALRHGGKIEEIEHDGAETVLKVTPAQLPEPTKDKPAALPKGKRPLVRAPYYLIVT